MSKLRLPAPLKFLLICLFIAGIGFATWQGYEYFYSNPERNCRLLAAEIDKYDWDRDIALAIAKAESKCDPRARGDTDLIFRGCYKDLNLDLTRPGSLKSYQKVPCSSEHPERDYGYSVGAFQVRILPGRLECDTYDLATNVKCAYRVYEERERSFTPWSVFTDGKYRDFLPKPAASTPK